MSVVFGLLRIMESADNFDAGIRLIGRLFFIFNKHASGHMIKSAHVYP